MKPLRLAAVGCALLIALGVGSLFRLQECRRVTSPDGRFYAVATCRVWRTCVPMAPGSSGDKPGYVTVFMCSGQPCGTAPLPLAWMIDDLRWSPTAAEIPLVARWNLVAHTVER